MNFFSYQKKDSRDFGLRIESKKVLSAPSFNQKFVEIPGRDGRLLLPGGEFSNAEIVFTCFVIAKDGDELMQRIKDIKAWLLQKPDRYHRLENSYEKEFFRKAVFTSKLDIEEEMKKIGRMTLTFSCLPYRYLKSGETQERVSLPSAAIHNPMEISSLPEFKIQGTGSLSFILQNREGLFPFELKGDGKEITIDSERMLVFSADENRSGSFKAPLFPFLAPGDNRIETSQNITEFLIRPNWRCL